MHFSGKTPPQMLHKLPSCWMAWTAHVMSTEQRCGCECLPGFIEAATTLVWSMWSPGCDFLQPRKSGSELCCIPPSLPLSLEGEGELGSVGQQGRGYCFRSLHRPVGHQVIAAAHVLEYLCVLPSFSISNF